MSIDSLPGWLRELPIATPNRNGRALLAILRDRHADATGNDDRLLSVLELQRVVAMLDDGRLWIGDE